MKGTAMARVIALVLALLLLVALILLARTLWRNAESDRRLKAQYPLLAVLKGKAREDYLAVRWRWLTEHKSEADQAVKVAGNIKNLLGK